MSTSGEPFDQFSVSTLGFAEEQAIFQSQSQNARALTEHWFHNTMFCLGCGQDKLTRSRSNEPVLDFHCTNCNETYELKAKKGLFGNRIVDGAYATMLGRLQSNNNPNLALLTYDPSKLAVKSLVVVPRQYFTVDLIEKRKPLAPTARRAGWVGCNIHLGRIPMWGRVSVIVDGLKLAKPDIQSVWARVSFVDRTNGRTRTWLIDIMSCIEKVGVPEFLLSDIYAFEPVLQARYPENRHVRPKIRQQLQVLRDAGLLEFLGSGHYRLTEAWLTRR